MSTITLTPDHLHRLNALTAFASSDPVTPLLASVALSVVHGTLNAMATDRYAVATWEGECAPNEELALTVIPASLIAQAHKGSKGAHQVHLTAEDDGTLTFDWHAGAVTGEALEGNHPSVARMYPDTLPEGGELIPAGICVDSKLLARLAKLTRPHRKPAERVLGFDLSATTGDRPDIRATADGYDVLICPMRKAC